MKSLQCMLAAVIFIVSGCGGSNVASDSSDAGSTELASQYLADTEPAGAMPVGDARESVEDGQDVALVGTIGGSSEPFVDGLAAFTIVDPKVTYCPPEEGCPTPWDYCCTQDEVKENIATVKIVDSSGKIVAADARKILGVQELLTVVVEGKAERDDQGNLSIAASKIFVRTSE